MQDTVWNEVPLEEIVEQFLDYRGRTPKKLSMEWGDGNIPALSANNVQMGKINFEKGTQYGSEALYQRWMSSGDCAKSDIIMTMEAPLGNIAQIPDDRKYILSQRVILLKTKKHLINNDFLLQRLTWETFKLNFKSKPLERQHKGFNELNLKRFL